MKIFVEALTRQKALFTYSDRALIHSVLPWERSFVLFLKLLCLEDSAPASYLLLNAFRPRDWFRAQYRAVGG